MAQMPTVRVNRQGAVDPTSSEEEARAGAAKLEKEWGVARASGITVVEVGRVLAASPDRPRFFCLDKIHMTEPYHRLMAREWLKILVGARGPALGGAQ